MSLLLGYTVTTMHVLIVVVWLGTDFTVFSLSMSLLDRELPIAVRIDRARLAERFDLWVLKAFLLTTPLGVLTAHLRGYDVFATPWLALKLALLAVIFLIAVVIITGAAGSTQILERIEARPAEAPALEAALRKRVLGLAVPVLALHGLLIAIIFLAVSKWAVAA